MFYRRFFIRLIVSLTLVASLVCILHSIVYAQDDDGLSLPAIASHGNEADAHNQGIIISNDMFVYHPSQYGFDIQAFLETH